MPMLTSKSPAKPILLRSYNPNNQLLRMYQNHRPMMQPISLLLIPPFNIYVLSHFLYMLLFVFTFYLFVLPRITGCGDGLMV